MDEQSSDTDFTGGNPGQIMESTDLKDVRHVVIVMVMYRGFFPFLLRKRTNVWSLPGGEVEPEEALEDACIREVYEELGINVKDPRFLYDRYIPYKNILLHFFSGEYVSGVVSLKEPGDFDDLELLTSDEMAQLDGFTEHEDTFDYLETWEDTGIRPVLAL